MRENEKGVVNILLILIVIVLIAIVGLLAIRSTKSATSSVSDNEFEVKPPSEDIFLNQSPIIANPLDTSDWKVESYNLNLLDPYSKDKTASEYTLSFAVPYNWSVEEYDRKTVEMDNGDLSGEEYETANYVVSSPDGTLVMNFNAIPGGVPEWYPLPQDAILVDTYVPNPSGGSKIAWVVRYEDPDTGDMRYAETYSISDKNQLTTENEIFHWLNLNTDPFRTHDYGVNYTIETVYTGTSSDYDLSISTSDQIVSLLVGKESM